MRDARCKILYDDTQYSALKEAGSIKTDYPIMETPLLTLVKEITERPNVKTFHLTKPTV